MSTHSLRHSCPTFFLAGLFSGVFAAPFLWASLLPAPLHVSRGAVTARKSASDAISFRGYVLLTRARHGTDPVRPTRGLVGYVPSPDPPTPARRPSSLPSFPLRSLSGPNRQEARSTLIHALRSSGHPT